ncbi:hypothetical protein [Sphingomonas faeni]|uniref:hypothetical protein n=1 Tax=Sphingomonas faeni TaxID=185950 RepID=UPI003356BFE5
MLKTRNRKKAAEGEQAVRLLAEVTKSIGDLQNEDLLDLADIFSDDANTTLGRISSAEMQRRNLSL